MEGPVSFRILGGWAELGAWFLLWPGAGAPCGHRKASFGGLV